MNHKGFTLVELLIAISIIAILSVVGVTIFSNTQRDARNSARKSDIDAIFNAMETNYDSTTGQYAALQDAFFASGSTPKDPLNGQSRCGTGTSPCKYCISSSLNYNCTASDNTVSGGTTPYPAAGASYIVCTNLEGNGNPAYCKKGVR